MNTEHVRVEVRVIGLDSGLETVVRLPRVQNFEMNVPAQDGDATWALLPVFPDIAPCASRRSSFWASGRCVDAASIEHKKSADD